MISKFIEQVFEKVKSHSKYVLKGVELLNELLIALKKNDLGNAEASFNELLLIEKQADTIKREIIGELHSSFLHPDDREDILRLTIELDKIVGFAKSAAKRLIIMYHVGLSIPDSYYQVMEEIMHNTVEACDFVVNMVENIIKDPSKALEYSNMIEKREEEVDELRFKLLEKLCKDCSEKVNSICLFLPGIIDDIEEITDRAEDVGDIYKLFIIGK
ncbi:DUF47 family protein [Thermosphaera chiliense]|uniref:DUF47 family protein n=1 Tax=Thermosphaera chiliense TaxID=3402707 RepID=A0A7M1UPU3_9CREN|nr:DUF47 family protein [Thermosphaera aggregans]QOR94009.1 DUF47 family protein [Thermosphaera aggregans]